MHAPNPHWRQIGRGIFQTLLQSHHPLLDNGICDSHPLGCHHRHKLLAGHIGIFITASNTLQIFVWYSICMRMSVYLTACIIATTLAACELAAAPEPNQSAASSPSLTSEDRSGAPDCSSPEPLPATTAHGYVGDGVSFSMPFNPAWKLLPYDDAEGTLLFGGSRLQFSSFSGCSRVRDFTYNTREKRTAAEAKTVAEKEFPVSPGDVMIRTIGSVQAILITNIQGVCPAPTIEVPGSKHNYIFSLSCAALHMHDPLAALEALVRTVQLQ